MEKLLWSAIGTIVTFIITGGLNFIVERIRSIKDKPRFFIYELLYIGLVDNQRRYRLKGRLIGNRNNYYSFKSVCFELPGDCEWENDSICKCYGIFSDKKYNDNGVIINPTRSKSDEQESKLNNLVIDYSLDIGENRTYDIEACYSAPRDISSSSIKVYFKREAQDKKTNENKIKPKKCPNIRQFWLRFYIFFSMFITFLGIASVWICGENWNCLKEACSETWPDLQVVLVVFGLILLIITVFFIGVFLRCLYALHVLKIMDKYTIPKKNPNIAVTETLLVPRIFQYMTGTEDVDNLL